MFTVSFVYCTCAYLYCKFIIPSILYAHCSWCTISLGWCLSEHTSGEYNLDSSPGYHGTDTHTVYKQATTFTLTVHLGDKLRVSNSPDLHVFGLRAPEETHRHGKNVNSTQKCPSQLVDLYPATVPAPHTITMILRIYLSTSV